MKRTYNENGQMLTPVERDDAKIEDAPDGVQPPIEPTELQPQGNSPTPETSQDLTGVLIRLEANLCQLGQSMDVLQARVANLEAIADSTARQVSFLPPQLRSLSGKVEGIAFSISELRYKAILLNLLGIYDLVDQMLRTLPPVSENDAVAEHRHNYQVLRTQLGQILEANGLSEIPADGVFDPTVHRALRTVSCADPAQINRIVEIIRPGFRTEQTVLRYAEVVVSRYTPETEAGLQHSVQTIDQNKIT